MTSTETPELGQLAEYEIVGELSGRDQARRFLATRRADRRGVLITVARQPAGDEGNALSHLAADTNLLASSPHPHVVPVVEGRWLGTDAFARITQRPAWPTLDELLTRREEDFPFTRVAAVLRDVNAALEWGREQKVVHRALRPEDVYVEPGSDDVQVSFAIAPLPATGMPGPEADARTVASLARAMFTRNTMDPERDALPLGELRPGLPADLIEQTDALLSPGDGPVQDVSGYIASIAMAEDLKRAEVERGNIRREIEEEQRRIRGELAAEREAHDRDLAEQEKRFAEERERERAAMAKEREKAEKELARARAALEKDRQRLAREREKFQEEMARSREQLAARLAAIGEQETLYAATSELPAAGAGDAPDQSDVAASEDMTPLVEHATDVPAEPYDELVDDDWSKTDDALAPALTPAARGWRDRLDRSPALRAAGIALVLLVAFVAASAITLARRGHPRVAQRQPPARVDSIGGSVAPVTAADTTSLSAAIAAPVDTPAPSVVRPDVPSPRPTRRPASSTPAAAQAFGARDSATTTPVGDSVMPADSAGQRTARRLTPARADSATRPPFTGTDSARRDSARTVRDSLSRVLSPKVVLPKPDTIAPRRDTTATR